MKVKIRGIFSTALTKFFIDSKVDVVSPSDIQAERFGEDSFSEGAPTVFIQDREDREGIYIVGVDAETASQLIKDSFPDVVLCYDEIGRILEVEVVEKKDCIVYVRDELGREGVIIGEEVPEDKFLAQVKGFYQGKVLYTRKFRIFGISAVLIYKGTSSVSTAIQDPLERSRLMKLAEEIGLEDWGILWTSNAAGESMENLLEEVNALVEKGEAILDGKKVPHSRGIHVIFGNLTLEKLDEIRGTVVDTVPGHHFLRIMGYSDILDFIETKGCSDVLEFLCRRKNRPGRRIVIRHIKPSGKVAKIRRTVVEVRDNKIVGVKSLKEGTTLDGLEIKVGSGWIVRTEISDHGCETVHTYIDSQGNVVGKYISINSPAKILPGFIRYIDLEIDIVEIGDSRKAIDVEPFNMLLQQDLLSPALRESVNKIIKEYGVVA